MITARFDMEFPHEGKQTQVLVTRGKLVLGTLVIKHAGLPVADIFRVHVAAGQRRKGIGTQLLDYATQIALESGCEALSLFVKPKNATAIAFYRAQGFKLAHVYYDGDWLMTKSLR